jgi:hypothetical protein
MSLALDSAPSVLLNLLPVGEPGAGRTSRLRQLSRWLLPLGPVGVLLGLIWSVALIVAIWYFFLTSEGYVDYVDGLVLFHQTQAAAGQNIYDPSYRNAPPYSVPLYGPVFYYLVGWMLPEHPSLLPGRLVSLGSVLGISGISWWVLRRRFHTPFLLAAIGSIPWLVLRGPFEFAVNNRVDSLAIFFGIAALITAVVAKRQGWCWAIPLLLLSGFTKPTAAVAPALAVFFALLIERRFQAAALFAAILAAGVYLVLCVGDACSNGNFSQCLLGSTAALHWSAAASLTESACKQVIFPVGAAAGLLLLRDGATRLFGLHAVACFIIAAGTSAKIGANYNYFLEPSWAALFCCALALNRGQSRPGYRWALALTAVLLLQSAGRITPHLQRHYHRMAQWPRTMLAVQKFGEQGPLLTMQVGAQVLCGQQPYVADVFILTCLQKAGQFDLGPIHEDLRRQRIAAVIARDEVRPEAAGNVIWSDDQRALIAAYYRPIERFGDLTVFIPRRPPFAEVPLRPANDDDWTGPVRTYYQNGQKESEATLLHGRKHGVERFWDNTGHLWREMQYVHGIPDGPEVTWYDNGQKASTVQYVNGRRQGLETTWYENGRKWMETPYLDDLPHGIATRWDPQGKQIAETHWNHGVPRRLPNGMQEKLFAREGLGHNRLARQPARQPAEDLP